MGRGGGLAMWAGTVASPCGQGRRLGHVSRGGGLAMWAGTVASPCGQGQRLCHGGRGGGFAMGAGAAAWPCGQARWVGHVGRRGGLAMWADNPVGRSKEQKAFNARKKHVVRKPTISNWLKDTILKFF